MNHTAVGAQYSTLMPKLVNFVKMLIYVAANNAQRKVTPVFALRLVCSDIVHNNSNFTNFLHSDWLFGRFYTSIKAMRNDWLFGRFYTSIKAMRKNTRFSP